MSERPWYKKYPSDFLHGTAGMRLELKGAYSVVLDLIYDRGTSIPDDARWIAGHCGCSVRKWKCIRSELIAAGKLTEDGGSLTNKRALREVGIASEASRKLAENGAKGGNKSAETRRNLAEKELLNNKNNDLDEASLTAGLNHARAFQKPEARTPKAPALERGEIDAYFEAFKAAYPRRDGAQDWPKAKKRFAALVGKRTPPQRIVEAARVYAEQASKNGLAGSQFVKQAATFLTSVWQEFAEVAQHPSKVSPVGWPSSLPAFDRVRDAWAAGHWPGNWGAPPGKDGCRVPPEIVREWAQASESHGAAHPIGGGL